jgi:CheY-like chemotaxis protein
MMQRNYGSVSDASAIGPLLSFVTAHVSNFFQPLGKDGSPDAPVSGYGRSSSSENEGKPRALIVDDVTDVTEMLSVFLTLAGYEVATAHSASAAIEAAQSAHFDVVISDIGMPQMNGYELARALRATPGYEAVPLVAVTGFSMYDDRERSLQCGFNAHLTKPIDPNVLFQIIERLRG